MTEHWIITVFLVQPVSIFDAFKRNKQFPSKQPTNSFSRQYVDFFHWLFIRLTFYLILKILKTFLHFNLLAFLKKNLQDLLHTPIKFQSRTDGIKAKCTGGYWRDTCLDTCLLLLILQKPQNYGSKSIFCFKLFTFFFSVIKIIENSVKRHVLATFTDTNNKNCVRKMFCTSLCLPLHATDDPKTYKIKHKSKL